MRQLVCLVLMIASIATAQTKYIYAERGAAQCAPRDLPSVGVRLDTGQSVLGLHGAGTAIREACGWYQVAPSATRPQTNQYVAARIYELGKGGFQEVLVMSNRVTRTVTPQARIEQAFAALSASLTTDDRCTAIVAAVAAVITNKFAQEVTIRIPASTGDVTKK